MREMDSQQKQQRREGGFLLCVVFAVAACLLLAAWFAPPRSVSSGRTHEMTLVQQIRVDLNTADAATLCFLPGVGEKRAQAILEYRQTHGAFRRVSEAAEVPGLTKDLVDSWGELAYVS